MKKLMCAVLIAGAVGGAAKAADLPTAKPAEAEPSKPSCFSSLWDYLKSSIKDCPLRYGPITLYGTLDGGYGYELWGAKWPEHVDNRPPLGAKGRRRLGNHRRRRSWLQPLHAAPGQWPSIAGRQQFLHPRQPEHPF